MTTKLNSMRLLEKNDVPYDVVEYPDTMRDAEEIAEVLGVPPHLVYKTLVIEAVGVPGAKPCLVMIASNRHLDLKRMAVVAGFKKVGMAAHKDAERLTGLQVGGISALALTHKNWPVFLDEPATQHQHILISGGKRGVDLRVPTAALLRVLRARVADVSNPTEE